MDTKVARFYCHACGKELTKNKNVNQTIKPRFGACKTCRVAEKQDGDKNTRAGIEKYHVRRPDEPEALELNQDFAVEIQVCLERQVNQLFLVPAPAEIKWANSPFKKLGVRKDQA